MSDKDYSKEALTTHHRPLLTQLFDQGTGYSSTCELLPGPSPTLITHHKISTMEDTIKLKMVVGIKVTPPQLGDRQRSGSEVQGGGGGYEISKLVLCRDVACTNGYVGPMAAKKNWPCFWVGKGHVMILISFVTL